MKARKWLKRGLAISMGLVLVASFTSCKQVKNEYAVQNENKIKNVILMISDGASVDGFTLSRLYQNGLDGGNLEIQDYCTGLVKTYWAEGPITDSAPSGTSYATGVKSYSGQIGVTMENEQPIPKASLLEAAKERGMSTGLVATSEFMHATPASFAAHVQSRADYDAISEQMLYSGVDVVLAGGSNIEGDFNKKNRKDGEDLVAEAKSLGYEYITSYEQLKDVKSDKIWGAFAKGSIPYDFDRGEKDAVLSGMTEKALEVLSKNENGFVLMVEGSKVDSGGHSNDPVAIISETLAYNEAFKKAIDFAKSREDTVVISVSDHATGGMAIGSSYSEPGYEEMSIDEFIPALKKAKNTADGAIELLKKGASHDKVLKAYGIDDATAKERALFKKKPKAETLVKFMQARSKIGFTTGGHDGGDVALFMYAPDGNNLTGVVNNIDVNKYICDVLGFDLAKTTENKFRPLIKFLADKGVEPQFDEDLSVIVKAGEKEVKIPINKNYVLVDGEKKVVSGITILFPFEIYVCQDVIDLLTVTEN